MWPNPQETADLVTFTEKILNGKLHFLCSGNNYLPDSVETSSLSNLINRKTCQKNLSGTTNVNQ